VEINPDENYRQVTVRLFHKGVILRGEQPGGMIRTTRQWCVREGQVLLSRIDARNGAIGLVPKELDGAIVTNDFWAFGVSRDLADPRFLDLYFGTTQFVESCQRASEGTTNRVRLQPVRFLQIEVPLPQLPEQRRIVARIEELSAKIDEARGLRQRSIEETRAVNVSVIDATISSHWSSTKLDEIVPPDRAITYGIVQAGPHFDDGIPYIRVSDMKNAQLTPVGMMRTHRSIAERYERSTVRQGDIVFAIRATVGTMRIVPAELDGANLTQGTARIAPSKLAGAQYLMWALQGRSAREQIEAACKGSTFREITLKKLREIRIPLPPIKEQQRIVTYLDDLQAKVDNLKKLQEDTAKELEALMPSILSKAFSGHL
jgi:type I restriction enzyme S subunit